MSKLFLSHTIERSYWALCYGAPKTPGTNTNQWIRLETLIGRSPTDRKKMSCHVRSGRKAVSKIRKLAEFSVPTKKPFASWMEVELETGRTHQVRVHLTSLGHSILGDPVYGTPTEKQTKWQALPKQVQKEVQLLPGQALHARVLGFQHPVTGEQMRFEAAPPAQFQNLLDTMASFSSNRR